MSLFQELGASNGKKPGHHFGGRPGSSKPRQINLQPLGDALHRGECGYPPQKLLADKVNVCADKKGECPHIHLLSDLYRSTGYNSWIGESQLDWGV